MQIHNLQPKYLFQSSLLQLYSPTNNPQPPEKGKYYNHKTERIELSKLLQQRTEAAWNVPSDRARKRRTYLRNSTTRYSIYFSPFFTSITYRLLKAESASYQDVVVQNSKLWTPLFLAPGISYHKPLLPQGTSEQGHISLQQNITWTETTFYFSLSKI